LLEYLKYIALSATLVPLLALLETFREMRSCGVSSLTKKAEPPPTRDVNRDSGTASANGGWLRRLVRPHRHT
jgi:hypothetical protein